MPRGDRTGPQGQGPGTGKGLGPCGAGTDGSSMPEENSGFFRRLGRRLGFGRSGQGRGMGRGQGAPAGRGRNR